MEIKTSPIDTAVCWAGGIAENMVCANFSLLDMQKCNHARDKGELDGGDDEEKGEGDVEGFLLGHSVSLFKF